MAVNMYACRTRTSTRQIRSSSPRAKWIGTNITVQKVKQMVNDSVTNDTSGRSPRLLSSMIIVDGISAWLTSYLFDYHIQMTGYLFVYTTNVRIRLGQQAHFAEWVALGYLASCVVSVI